MKNNSIPISALRERFTPEARWLMRPRDHFKSDRDWKAWNTLYAGKLAGTLTKGALSIKLKIDGRWYHLLAHRVVFALANGRWPDDQIDHKNRSPADNRQDNLREATNAQNQQNRGLDRNNTSGCKGVTWAKLRGKWQAQIVVDGRSICLGRYDRFEDAVARRKAAEAELHPFREMV